MFIEDSDPLVDLGIIKLKDSQIKDFVKHKLATDKAWALKALIKIYEFQTSEEQEIERTCVHNSIGFSGVDGKILTSFAKQYLKRGFLSPKQMILVYKKMPKYWNQIIKISDEKKLRRIITTSLVS